MIEYISKKIYSKKMIDDTKKKISLLGINHKINPYIYLNIKYIGIILIFLTLIIKYKYGFIIAPIASFIYYKFITYILIKYPLKQREEQLEHEALNFFEILTLSLETGRNLTDAFSVTTESCTGELVYEFKEVLREVKFGKSLNEALRSAEERIPSYTINNIILTLTEANLYGSSIINSLNNQIDYLREKRRQEVKAKISKVPIKISIISVFFFIPLILLIILGPVLLNYLNT